MHTLELSCADQLVGNDGRGAVAFQAVFAAPARQAEEEVQHKINTMGRSKMGVYQAELLNNNSDGDGGQ